MLDEQLAECSTDATFSSQGSASARFQQAVTQLLATAFASLLLLAMFAALTLGPYLPEADNEGCDRAEGGGDGFPRRPSSSVNAFFLSPQPARRYTQA